MRNFFGGGSKSGHARDKGNDHSVRHSSGWKEMLKNLQRRESLRVLDIGPTSSTNINFITGMGHSIYMSNLVDEAARPEWIVASAEDGSPTFAVDRFLAANLDFAGRSFDVFSFLEANLKFSGRMFDVVLLWDASDYLPESLLPHLMHRMHEVMAPEGQMLAFYHAKPTAGSSAPRIDHGFFRYSLNGDDTVDLQMAGQFPLVSMYTNRQIETLLKDFSNFRFFLAKDNLREVIATR